VVFKDDSPVEVVFKDDSPVVCTQRRPYRLSSLNKSSFVERWGAGLETQKNVRGEIGGWGRVPSNETMVFKDDSPVVFKDERRHTKDDTVVFEYVSTLLS